MTVVTARLAPNQTIGKDTFTDLVRYAIRSVKWSEDGQVCVDFDDGPNDGGTMTDTEIAAVRLRLTSATPAEETTRATLGDFDPTTADLPSVAAAVAALIKLANGESD